MSVQPEGAATPENRPESAAEGAERREPVTSWHDRHEAARAIAQREADNTAGPCVHCGGPVTAELFDVSWVTGPRFVPHDYRCVAQCWETDPDGYEASAKRRAHAERAERDLLVGYVPDDAWVRPGRRHRWFRKAG